MSDNPKAPRTGAGSSKLGAWGWLTLVVLVGLLIAAIVYAVHAWNSVHTQVSTAGWIFMTMGVIFTILVGGGLMALVFYSSRHDYDR
ncbi:MAG TPA: hypothetical protein VGG48_16870 [Rhizomicrobium sp.]|jgi:hypothetical protein